MNVNPIQKLLIPLFRVYFIGVSNSYELVQDGLCIQNMVILQNTYRPTQCSYIIMLKKIITLSLPFTLDNIPAH